MEIMNVVYALIAIVGGYYLFNWIADNLEGLIQLALYAFLFVLILGTLKFILVILSLIFSL